MFRKKLGGERGPIVVVKFKIYHFTTEIIIGSPVVAFLFSSPHKIIFQGWQDGNVSNWQTKLIRTEVRKKIDSTLMGLTQAWLIKFLWIFNDISAPEEIPRKKVKASE